MKILKETMAQATIEDLQKSLQNLSHSLAMNNSFNNYSEGFDYDDAMEKDRLSGDLQGNLASLTKMINETQESNPKLLDEWLELNLKLLKDKKYELENSKDEDLLVYYEQKIFSCQRLIDQWQAFNETKKFVIDIAFYWDLEIQGFQTY